MFSAIAIRGRLDLARTANDWPTIGADPDALRVVAFLERLERLRSEDLSSVAYEVILDATTAARLLIPVLPEQTISLLESSRPRASCDWHTTVRTTRLGARRSSHAERFKRAVDAGLIVATTDGLHDDPNRAYRLTKNGHRPRRGEPNVYTAKRFRSSFDCCCRRDQHPYASRHKRTFGRKAPSKVFELQEAQR